MRVILALLVVAIFSSVESKTLTEILDKHWARFQASPLADQLRELRQKRVATAFTEEQEHEHEHEDDEPAEHIDHGHKCEHEDWLERSGMKDKQNRIKEKLKQHPVPVNATKKRQSGSVGPIRLYSNSDALNVNDPNSCKAVGQTVTLDSGDTYTCGQNDLITATKISIMKETIMPAITELFAEMISLPQVEGNLILSKQYADISGDKDCRPLAPIPDDAFTTGVSGSDYYIIWLLRPIDSQSVIANAGACNYNVLPDGKLSRPLAGSVNFNPAADNMVDFDPDNKFKLEKVIRVGLHEITHALGFSSFNYEYFTNDKGEFYRAVSTGAARGTSVYKFTGPNVVKQARFHYGCDSLDGLELENNDPSSPGSHWETRLTGPEYMSPTVDEQIPISALSLAFLQDTGWYTANFAFSERLMWGYKKGCPWATAKCSSWSADYFCTANKQKGCNPDLSARGECVIGRVGSIPTPFRYFPDPELGGDVWADYCTTVVPYKYGYCEDKLNQVERDSVSKRWNEFYGDGSSCWNYVVPNDSTTINGACWLKRCALIDGKVILQFKIQTTWYSCPTNGGVITARVSDGTAISVTCPSTDGWCTGVTADSQNAQTPKPTADSTPSPSTDPTPSPIVPIFGGSGSSSLAVNVILSFLGIFACFLL